MENMLLRASKNNYDFNIKYDYYGHSYYEKWVFSDKEQEILFELFNLPIEDEIYLLSFEDYFSLVEKNFTENISKFYNQLPYSLFLKSPYWVIVRNYKKKTTGNKCQVCNSKKTLHVHHNNYNNRGYEYKNLNDLIVLCSKCHKKFHNKG